MLQWKEHGFGKEQSWAYILAQLSLCYIALDGSVSLCELLLSNAQNGDKSSFLAGCRET